jgi:hypothetical protein
MCGVVQLLSISIMSSAWLLNSQERSDDFHGSSYHRNTYHEPSSAQGHISAYSSPNSNDFHASTQQPIETSSIAGESVDQTSRGLSISNPSIFTEVSPEDSPRSPSAFAKSRSTSKLLKFAFLFCLALELGATILTYFFQSHLFSVTDSDTMQRSVALTEARSVICLVVFIGCSLLEFSYLLYAARWLMHCLRIRHVKPLEVFSLYLATIICFASLYRIMYCFDLGCLFIPGKTSLDSAFQVFITLLYFSTVIFTSTGVGDVNPSLYYTKILCSLQEFVAVIFTVMVFGVALEHIKLSLVDSKPQRIYSAAKYLARWRDSNPRADAVRKWLLRYVLIVSVGTQFLLLTLLLAFDSTALINATASSEGIGMIILVAVVQFLQFLLICFISLKLIREINRRHVKLSFLIQGYLSTVEQSIHRCYRSFK